MRTTSALITLALIAAVPGCGSGGGDNHPDADPAKSGSRSHRPGNTAPAEDGSTAGESDGRTARPGGGPATPAPATP
jgi:hypothetical protein